MNVKCRIRNVKCKIINVKCKSSRTRGISYYYIVFKFIRNENNYNILLAYCRELLHFTFIILHFTFSALHFNFKEN